MSSTNPVLLVHGFTQTARSWGRFADRLAEAGAVVAATLPGHGSRPTTPSSLWGAADELSPAEPHTVIGYSMGARVALHLALAHPHKVAALVMLSGTAGLRDEADRHARIEADAALADRIEAIGVAAFLDEWLSLPLFAGLPPDPGSRADRLDNTPAGLAAALRALGTGVQEDLWDRLADLSMPVLLVVGADDPKFSRIGREMVAAIGANAQLVVIRDAGHVVHLEAPDATADAVIGWLDGLTAR